MNNEMFALIEDGAREGGTRIFNVIRTYVSKTRAAEDLDLLRAAIPTSTFAIVAVEHIDA